VYDGGGERICVMGEERENIVAVAAAAVDLGPYPADPGPRDAIFCDAISIK